MKNPLYNTPSPLASAIYSMFWAARMPFVLSFAVMTMTTGALKKKKWSSIFMFLAIGLNRSAMGFIFLNTLTAICSMRFFSFSSTVKDTSCMFLAVWVRVPASNIWSITSFGTGSCLKRRMLLRNRITSSTSRGFRRISPCFSFWSVW